MLAKAILLKARERLATVASSATLRDVAVVMSQPNTDLVVACDDDGTMVGVLTKTDVVRRIGRCSGASCTSVTVETFMTRAVVSCRTDAVLHDVWLMMKARSLQRVPVIDDAVRPVGIIYARDALQNLLGEVEDEEALLRDYVTGVGYR